MTENTRNILNNRITLFSFILSVFVVYLHAENSDWYNLLLCNGIFSKSVLSFEWFISKDIAKAAVPGFFMLSGLLFYKHFDMSFYKVKMTSRFFSLFIPYICWNTLRFLYAFIIRNILAVGEEQVLLSVENILSSIFLYKYNQGYWYMFQLILYVALCPVVYLFVKNKLVGFLTVLFLLFFNLIPGLPNKIPYLLTDSFFFYFLGSFLGKYYFDYLNLKYNHPIRIGIILLFFSQIFMFLYTKTEFMLYYFTFCILIVIALFILTSLVQKTSIPMWMGFSFFIYSLHGTVLEVMQKALFYIFPRNPLFAIVEYVFLPVFTIVLICLVGLFLQTKIPFIWKILNGGRQTKKVK